MSRSAGDATPDKQETPFPAPWPLELTDFALSDPFPDDFYVRSVELFVTEHGVTYGIDIGKLGGLPEAAYGPSLYDAAYSAVLERVQTPGGRRKTRLNKKEVAGIVVPLVDAIIHVVGVVAGKSQES